MHSLIKVLNAARATPPPLSFVLSERGQRGGRGADDDVGDVSDVPQEGLCRRRSREEGKQVGGGEGWREGRGTYDQIGRVTCGTNPKAKGVGSGGTGGGAGEGGGKHLRIKETPGLPSGTPRVKG